MRISTVVKSLLAVAAATPLLCQAESTFNGTGASPSTASAHVDFQISIPKFIFLNVGKGTGAIDAAGKFTTPPGSLNTIDGITWTLLAGNVGTGVLAGTGGDLGGGVETAILVANNGTVTLTSTTTGALSDAAGPGADTISYAKITTNATTNHTATVLAAPALADGATTTLTITPAAGKVVAQDAKWAYTYANDFVPAAGTYGGVNTNNSRVTYTASVP